MGRNYVIHIFTVRELYELKDFSNIKFEKPDRNTVIEAWIGPRCSNRLCRFVLALYYGGKVATVVFVGVQ